MGTRYEIIAVHYPFKGYYEESFQCATLWAALVQFSLNKDILSTFLLLEINYKL